MFLFLDDTHGWLTIRTPTQQDERMGAFMCFLCPPRCPNKNGIYMLLQSAISIIGLALLTFGNRATPLNPAPNWMCSPVMQNDLTL